MTDDEDGLDTLLAYAATAFLGLCVLAGAIWGGWRLLKYLGWF